MATTKGSRLQYQCSFCAKSQDQVKKLIAGPGAVYICDECVELCREIIEEEGGPAKAKTGQKVPPPKTLYEQLSEYVIGQDPERIRRDFDRNFYMDAQQAKEYGMIDEILARQGV